MLQQHPARLIVQRCIETALSIIGLHSSSRGKVIPIPEPQRPDTAHAGLAFFSHLAPAASRNLHSSTFPEAGTSGSLTCRMLEAHSCCMMMLLRLCIEDTGRGAADLSGKHRKGVYTASRHAAANLLGLPLPEVKCLSQHIGCDLLNDAWLSLCLAQL